MTRLVSLTLLLGLVGFLLLAFAIRLKHTGLPLERVDLRNNEQDWHAFVRQHQNIRPIDDPLRF